jgi:hypothetical protein
MNTTKQTNEKAGAPDNAQTKRPVKLEELQSWYQHVSEEREAYKAHACKLAEALREIFRQCACVHKYWGEGCNQREADAAVTQASEALAAYEAGKATAERLAREAKGAR